MRGTAAVLIAVVLPTLSGHILSSPLHCVLRPLHRPPFNGNMCKLSTCSVDITFDTNTVKCVKRAPARLTPGTVWASVCTTSDACMIIRGGVIGGESGCSVDLLKGSCSIDMFYRTSSGCGSSCRGYSRSSSCMMCHPSTAAVF